MSISNRQLIRLHFLLCLLAVSILSAPWATAQAEIGAESAPAAYEESTRRPRSADSFLTLESSPANQTIEIGATARFTVTLRNNAATELYNLVIAANGVTDCARPVPFDLPDQGFMRYTCEQPAAEVDMDNTLLATGCLLKESPCPTGQSVTATATSAIDVISPAIDVDIAPKSLTVLRGSTVTFTVSLTNSGNIPLDHVGVVDTELPACGLPLVAERRLDPGQSITYSCAAPALTADLGHTLYAEGSPPTGRFVEAVVSATIDVISPELTLSLLPAISKVERYTPVQLAVEVHNAGDTTLTEVHIDSGAAPDCARNLPDPLLPGATVGYGCSLTATGLDVDVRLSGRGMTSIGSFADANATAHIDVRAPQLRVVKRSHESVVGVGRPVTFTIVVSNTGDAAISQISVVDALLPACSIEALFSLAPGASRTHGCQLPQITAPLTNTVDVNATAEAPFANEPVVAQAAAYVRTAIFSTVGDRVWDDLNGDGIQDEGEPGLAAVRIVAEELDSGESVETVTDGSGRYGFDRLLPGAYRMTFFAPQGYVGTLPNRGDDEARDSDLDPGSGQIQDLSVGFDSLTAQIDAGFYRPATLGDRIWYDADADGIQDGGEAGAANVIVRLHAADGIVAEAKTGQDGGYRVQGLQPGRYWLEIQLPQLNDRFSPLRAGAGVDDSAIDPETGRSAPVTLLSGSAASGMDAGFFSLSVVHGTVVGIETLDADIGGTGIADITLRLFAQRANSSVTLHSVTTTDSAGRFVFTDVPAGEFYLHVDLPAGTALLEVTPPEAGGEYLIEPRSDATTRHFAVEGASIGEPHHLALAGGATSDDHVLLFWADGLRDGVVLRWLVRKDPDVRSYEIMRALTADREQAILVETFATTPGAQASKGVEIHGHIDMGLQAGATGFYWLEVVGENDVRRTHGPIEAILDPTSDRAVQRVHLPAMILSR